jgi:diguanylate cyclase (GGDEF)-like protein/PAS domain S-box-containing protein
MNSDRRKWLEALWETSVDGVIVVGSGGLIVEANPAAVRLFEYEKGELDGCAIETLIPPELHAIHQSHRASYGKNPRPRVMRGTQELVGVTKRGREIPVEICLTPVALDPPVTVAVVRDVSSRHAYEEKLRHLGFHDALTGLHNRAFFEEELERLEVGRLRPVAILVADIDGLKLTNDGLGHAEGDELIRLAGNILKSSVRVEDIVARFGGDEFVVLLPGVGAELLAEVTRRIRSNVSTGGSSRGLRLSIGGAVGQAGDLLKDVLRRADANMYDDKRSGS